MTQWDRPGQSNSRAVVDDTGAPIEPIEVFLAYLVAIGRSPNTVKAYAYQLALFFRWLDLQDLRFDKLAIDVFPRYFAWLRDRPLAIPRRVPREHSVSASTAVGMRRRLVCFYRFHARRRPADDVLACLAALTEPLNLDALTALNYRGHTRGSRAAQRWNPLALDIPRVPPKVITDVERQAVMAACPTSRDKFLFLLLFESGLRLGEALGLRHQDLHPSQTMVEVVPRLDNVNGARVKNLKYRQVPVPPAVFEAYADYMRSEYRSTTSYVFVNLRRHVGNPMDRTAVYRAVYYVRKKTGIERFGPQVLRHTYATNLLRAGVRAETVSDLLGHAGPTPTYRLYGHFTIDDHRKALTDAGLLPKPIHHATPSSAPIDGA